jgi:hypothetical protein
MMRTAKEIRSRLAEIEADERYKSGRKKAATVFENAPLALIQMGLESQHAALTWVLNRSPRLPRAGAHAGLEKQ